jgi:hypothetical protein
VPRSLVGPRLESVSAVIGAVSSIWRAREA